jgi:hypothetical protein
MKPGSSKRRRLGLKEQEYCAKARFVKLPECELKLGARPEKTSLGFSQGDARSRGGLALCVAKPKVGSPSRGLIRQGGSPALSKPNESKETEFGRLGGLSTGEEARGCRAPEATKAGGQ